MHSVEAWGNRLLRGHRERKVGFFVQGSRNIEKWICRKMVPVHGISSVGMRAHVAIVLRGELCV